MNKITVKTIRLLSCVSVLFVSSALHAEQFKTLKEKRAFKEKMHFDYIDTVKNETGKSLDLDGLGMANFEDQAKAAMPNVNCSKKGQESKQGVSAAIHKFMCKRKDREAAFAGKTIELGQFVIDGFTMKLGATVKGNTLVILDLEKVSR